MKLSIIVTAFNSEKFVRSSLDSIYDSDLKDYEVILVDDGSTDNTKNILAEYVDKNSNTRLLINARNYGIPISRNRALLIAEGEYIAIHDSDDISLPGRFQKEIQFLDENKQIDFMGGHAIKISATGEVLGCMAYPPKHTRGAWDVINRYKLNPIIDPSCMYRRNVIVQQGGYTLDPKLRTVLDFHLWCRLLVDGCQLANLQEPLIKYRINPQGVTRTENNTMVEATDLVWATFRRRNFKREILKADLFWQDCFQEYRNKNQREQCKE